MKYFITGATGTLGKEVVKALLNKGHKVKAGSRNPQKDKTIENQHVESVYFDYEEEHTFHNASEVDGIFLMEPPALNPKNTDLAHSFLDYLIRNKPKRFIYLSSHGMENLEEVPFHLRMEEKIKRSILNWHIIRPSFYAQSFGVYERDNIEQRNIIFLPAGRGKTPFVSTLDVGEAVAILLTMNKFPSHEISILTGEEAFDHFEVADMLSEILGRTITNVDPEESVYRKVLQENNIPAMIADYIIPLYGLIKNAKVEAVTPDLKKLINRNPEPLKKVLQRDFLKL
ncbi:MAG: NAD(P)H-binding protein [Thermonemataceae bacterium]